MSDKRTLSPLESSRAYLFVGITFLAVAIVFLTTKQGSALWISFFAIGIVFMSLSFSQRPKPDAEKTDDEKPDAEKTDEPTDPSDDDRTA